MAVMTYLQAISSALRDELRADERVLVMGEDIGVFGGAFDSGGQLAAIDFNPRPYGSLSLAVAAGAPLPALWCTWCAGERRAQVAARPGVRYRWEDADLRHALWQMRKGNWPAGIAAVRPHRATVHAYFRLGDPGPIAARALQLVREEAHRMRSP
jgi:hypothetical protein